MYLVVGAAIIGAGIGGVLMMFEPRRPRRNQDEAKHKPECNTDGDS